MVVARQPVPSTEVWGSRHGWSRKWLKKQLRVRSGVVESTFSLFTAIPALHVSPQRYLVRHKDVAHTRRTVSLISLTSVLPQYCDVDDDEGGRLRMAWVEDGPSSADPVLMLHGEPSWSYLYHRMIPIVAAAGWRLYARIWSGSAVPTSRPAAKTNSYARHVEWVRALVFDELNLTNVTLVGQDRGGLIGLRLAAEHPSGFARIVVANTGLPTGDVPMPEIWWQFPSSY